MVDKVALGLELHICISFVQQTRILGLIAAKQPLSTYDNYGSNSLIEANTLNGD